MCTWYLAASLLLHQFLNLTLTEHGKQCEWLFRFSLYCHSCVCRRMAHAVAGTTDPVKLVQQRKAITDGTAAAAAGAKPGAQAAQGRTWAQWLGWQARPAAANVRTVASTAPPVTQTAPPSINAGGAPNSGAAGARGNAEMGAADWAKIEELLQQQVRAVA